jgi:hypothetical protein
MRHPKIRVLPADSPGHILNFGQAAFSAWVEHDAAEAERMLACLRLLTIDAPLPPLNQP